MRWLTPRKTIQHHDGMIEKIKGEPVLQTRVVQNMLEVANELQPPIWSEWQDVHIEYVEE